MARKSAWQQFADNFDSTYKTFNTMFSDIEEGKIMSEEPEELQSGIGPGPRSQYQASYGGQIYNEKITPEKLRGLRNQRLIDNMNKWGDTEGAMKMQLDQATLRNQNAAADLAEGQLQDRIANAGLQNKALLASIGLTEAQIEEYKKLLPHKQTEYILNAIAKRSDNRVKLRTEDDKVSKSASDASTAESNASAAKSAASVAAMEEKDMKDTSYLRRQEQRTAYLAAIEENKAKKIGSKVALSENNQKLAVNDMMAEFRDLAANDTFVDADGNADNQAAKDWIVGKLYNINPTLADDMQENYNSNEVAVITHSSTMFKTKAMDAYTNGGVQGLSEAINNLNGVDDTRFEIDEESGDATIWAVDSKTGKDIRKIVYGNPKPGGTFEMNLQQVLDPAASMEISKAYHDDLKVQADILLKEAEAEYTKEMTAKVKAEGIAAGKEKKEFDKEDFLIRLLIDDPENELAWQGLVGMELTADEVRTKIREEKVRIQSQPKDENLDDGLSGEDSPAPDPDPEDDEVVAAIPEDSYEVTLASAKKLVAAGPPAEGLAPAAYERYDEAVKLVESLSNAENVQLEIDKVQASIDKTLQGPQRIGKKNKRKELEAKKVELEKILKSFSGLKQGG